MDSKAKKYVKDLGKKISDLPDKYKENFEVMDEFAEIMDVADQDSKEYQEAKEEWQDYDEQILKALKRDYPVSKKVSAPDRRYPIEDARKPTLRYPIEDARKPTIKGMPPVDDKGERRIDKAALDALEAHLDSLPQTKQMHSKNGEYTKERRLLHNQIITKEVTDNECIRRDDPIAILTGGLPGSGKSTFIRNNKDWMTNPAIFKIDADDLRAKLPEYKGWNATQTHEETRDLVKTLLNKVGKTGCSYDVIYDGTMNKSKKYKPLVETLKKEGYRVFIMFLKVDKKTSMTRAMNRYKKSGRYVPRFVIDEGAENGLSAFNELKTMVDGYVLVDGKTQKVIEEGGAKIPEDRNYTELSSEPAKKQQNKKSSRTKPSSKDHKHSWKKVTPKSQLKPVVLHCQHYHLPVTKEIPVGIKGTGNRTNNVTAKPGEHLIFDDKGKLVFIMDAASFARKCNDQSTVDEHVEEKHIGEPTKKVTVSAPSSKSSGKTSKKAAETSSKKTKATIAQKAKVDIYDTPESVLKKMPDEVREVFDKYTSMDEDSLKQFVWEFLDEIEQLDYTFDLDEDEFWPYNFRKIEAAKPAPKTYSKQTKNRRSPYAVLEAEIKDVTKILDKKNISKEDADRLPNELKDIDTRAKKSARQTTINYIKRQAIKIDQGKKLSKNEVVNLALAAQPLIRSGRSVVLDTLFTNKKRLEPTVDGLLRWLSNPSGYDLIGVDVKDSAKATVKPKRPKQDLLTILKIK